MKNNPPKAKQVKQILLTLARERYFASHLATTLISTEGDGPVNRWTVSSEQCRILSNANVELWMCA